jgi:hypothetical protein
MKTIAIYDREDLRDNAKLKEVEDIRTNDLKGISTEKRINEYVIIFICTLTNKIKILKSRYSGYTDKTIKIKSSEDKNEILKSLIGI